MSPDFLSVVVRSASFIALFQAAGMVIFIAVFDRHLEASLAPIRRIASLSALAAIALLVAHHALEAARMADSISGIIESSLQMMVWTSASSVVLAVRVAGLALIAIGNSRRSNASIFGLIGAVVIGASFTLTGHTSANPLRWVLAPLLMVHVMIVAFWFGALAPLYLVSRRESPAIAGRVTETFSRVAGWLVPGILVAGFLMGLILVRHLAEFRLAYGISLLGKLAGFAILMGFAALNKWRLGPQLATGDLKTLRFFRRSLGTEYVLIAAVLGITAVMTTFFSPEP